MSGGAEENRSVERPHFGVDAPYVPLALGIAALVFIVVGFVFAAGFLVIIGVVFALETAVYLHATLRGKFVLWERLLDDLALRGDETIIDLGCGRGAVLIAAARRLSTGTVHGVDLWRTVDQSGNDEAVTQANAAAAGVADRVELHTADLRELPFGADRFDVVVSSLAIHNLSDATDRRAAIDEAVRVLRPGGTLVIVDLRFIRDYAAVVRGAGFADVEVRSAGPGLWYSGPWQAASILTAVAPAELDVPTGS